jgi:glutaredoxin
VTNVHIYSRHGCHLCEVAEKTAKELQSEYSYQLSVEFIDGNPELEKEYGEKVPVILINGQPHDYWRIDRARFISAISN